MKNKIIITLPLFYILLTNFSVTAPKKPTSNPPEHTPAHYFDSTTPDEPQEKILPSNEHQNNEDTSADNPDPFHSNSTSLDPHENGHNYPGTPSPIALSFHNSLNSCPYLLTPFTDPLQRSMTPPPRSTRYPQQRLLIGSKRRAGSEGNINPKNLSISTLELFLQTCTQFNVLNSIKILNYRNDLTELNFDILNYQNPVGNTLLHTLIMNPANNLMSEFYALVNLIQGNNLTHYTPDPKINLNLKNNNGNTPLHLAIIHHRYEIIYFFLINLQNLNTPIDLTLQNQDGQTIFHLAIIDQNQVLVEELIKTITKANLKILELKNKQNQTLLDIVQSENYQNKNIRKIITALYKKHKLLKK